MPQLPSSFSAAKKRKELALAERDFVLLASGRLSSQKGFEYLLSAIPAIVAGCERPVRVLLAGDGPLETRLRKQADSLGFADRVHLLGFRSDLPELLGACDVVVLPSLWEGLSIALLEAMALGKPVVATSIPSNREVTREGQSALLVPIRDSKALADAVISLERDETQRRLIGSQATTVFNQSYTEGRMLEGYLDLYRGLAPGSQLP